MTFHIVVRGGRKELRTGFSKKSLNQQKKLHSMKKNILKPFNYRLDAVS